MIRIVIADDHALVRKGIAQVLENESGVEVVGLAADGEEAVAACRESNPDVILMDLSMPGVDGIEATKQIVERCPGVHVVVLTSFSDRDRILAALDAGAEGYLLKDSEPDVLVAGIHAAVRGEAPLDPRAGRALLAARAARQEAERLTGREREVLVLVGEGLPNKQIARRLQISEKTVKAHLTSIFRQIGVDDRTQAAIWARAHGLVES